MITNETQHYYKSGEASISPEQESDRKETHDGRRREKSNRFPRLDVRRELWDQTLVSQKRQDVTQLKL